MAMDFFYKPEIAATLAEYIGYVTPVPAAQALIQQHADEAPEEDKEYLELIAKSPLVFPDAATYAKLSYYVDFPDSASQQDCQTIFEPLVLS